MEVPDSEHVISPHWTMLISEMPPYTDFFSEITKKMTYKITKNRFDIQNGTSFCHSTYHLH